MDPCSFVRILIGNLALKFPKASKPAFSGIHPSSSPCYCKIKLKNFPTQIATIPLIPTDTPFPDHHHIQSQSPPTIFTISKLDEKKRVFSKAPCVKIDIYTGKRGTSCGFNSGKLLGSVSVPVDLNGAESKAVVFQNGWVSVGEDGKGSSRARAQLYLSVRAEPDPRFVFEFGGEPECSPQVFQVQGNIKQPVFSCKFSVRSCGDRNLGSRSSFSEPSTSTSRKWRNSLGGDKDHSTKERKGWSITIHDLSGSPVAAASMATPFVPSPGTDRVSRSNPGAWLILRPGDGTWKPWGRLEAWLERGSQDGLGYRFELLPDSNTTTTVATTVANSTISSKKGGKFTIDMTSSYNSPVVSPKSSSDFGSGSGSDHFQLLCPFRGFVMSSTVEGGAKAAQVEVGVQHVTCTEDAAAFVALAAAMDLSMDACRLFSHKLRKELR